MDAHWAEVKRAREERNKPDGVDTRGMDQNPLIARMFGRNRG